MNFLAQTDVVVNARIIVGRFIEMGLLKAILDTPYACLATLNLS